MSQSFTPKACSGGSGIGSLRHLPPPRTLPNQWPRPRQPSCGLKGCPPGDGFLFLLVSLLLGIPAVPHPQLWRGHLLPNRPYGGKVIHLPAHGPEVVHKLLRLDSCDILAIEACLPLLELLLTYKKCLANLYVLCSPPEINPATARLPPSVQTASIYRHSMDNRLLLVKNAGSRLPLPWHQPCPPSKN